MIVILIIATLMGIAMPNFNKAREQARKIACIANQKVLINAIEMYNVDFPDKIDTLNPITADYLLDKEYLRIIPHCPAGNDTQPYYGFNLATNGTIYCPHSTTYPDHVLYPEKKN